MTDVLDACATREETAPLDYDVLVVGAGIGGMESALKLGDMGYRVLLVEKEASVGGKMILLSKVFPTLDCASCISTPKMAATIHHANITPYTYSRVDEIRTGADGTFQAKVTRKARFVDIDACTGCQKCETACTVAVPDQFNAELVARRAAHITYPQAVPKKAVIDRAGSSPCSFACPAGIQAHGYVSLIRSGLDEEAYRLVLDATPFVGTLGRACYAPCEGDCTRGALEGTLPIRRLKRFASDAHDASGADNGVERPEPNGMRVAIVGSGPTGLTAAWQLARLGYAVKVFEAAPVAGGFLRLGIPSYRLPESVVERDIENVTGLGVEIVVDHPVSDPAALKDAGFDAVLVATGTHRSTSLGVPGEDRLGVMGGTDFLRKVKLGQPMELAGQRVVVVGGGNVAMDAARTARRLGAASVTVAYRRSRDEMPAHHVEAADAEKEGVEFRLLVAPAEVMGDAAGAVSGLRCQAMRLGAPDASGRRGAEPVTGSSVTIEADVIIAAIGMRPDTALFGDRIAVLPNGRLASDTATCQTTVPHVFAAGDAVHGPTDITRAVGEGRKAAHQVDAWLNGRAFDDWDSRLPVVDKAAVLARQKAYTASAPTPDGSALVAAPSDFSEVEAPLTEAEARRSSGRCIDCAVCSECNACVEACPVDGCIDLRARDETLEIRVGAVVVSTGFKLFAADLKPEYGFGRFRNVITGMQMDRLLAPTRPFNTILRPGDGKVPERIAYILCTGSRDETVGNPLCSRFCCMYSIKQNQLLMGALPLADITVHYMDIRAPGKRYDEFYEQAKAMGATYVKGRVANVEETPAGDLVLTYEDIENGGAITKAEYDLVVLAVGVQPNHDAERLFSVGELATDAWQWVDEPEEDVNPGQTSIPGVYVAGAASGAKDIADSILHAGAAVAQVAAHLERSRPLPLIEMVPA
ncbi:MAG TPA: FAD-dependent oxidoreductase [Candidatus Limnocylindrales bacterium]|nr:FAD-dependent oxidoreductase [Candidatus Limnocylindrales bacterium]